LKKNRVDVFQVLGFIKTVLSFFQIQNIPNQQHQVTHVVNQGQPVQRTKTKKQKQQQQQQQKQLQQPQHMINNHQQPQQSHLINQQQMQQQQVAIS